MWNEARAWWLSCWSQHASSPPPLVFTHMMFTRALASRMLQALKLHEDIGQLLWRSPGTGLVLCVFFESQFSITHASRCLDFTHMEQVEPCARKNACIATLDTRNSILTFYSVLEKGVVPVLPNQLSLIKYWPTVAVLGDPAMLRHQLWAPWTFDWTP